MVEIAIVVDCNVQANVLSFLLDRVMKFRMGVKIINIGTVNALAFKVGAQKLASALEHGLRVEFIPTQAATFTHVFMNNVTAKTAAVVTTNTHVVSEIKRLYTDEVPIFPMATQELVTLVELRDAVRVQ